MVFHSILGCATRGLDAESKSAPAAELLGRSGPKRLASGHCSVAMITPSGTPTSHGRGIVFPLVSNLHELCLQVAWAPMCAATHSASAPPAHTASGEIAPAQPDHHHHLAVADQCTDLVATAIHAAKRDNSGQLFFPSKNSGIISVARPSMRRDNFLSHKK